MCKNFFIETGSLHFKTFIFSFQIHGSGTQSHNDEDCLKYLMNLTVIVSNVGFTRCSRLLSGTQ